MNEIAHRLAMRLFDKPLIQNQYRSAFVEAMIEPYLALTGWRYTGDDWTGWDFEHASGAKLEVKQSAAKQTWSHITKVRGRGSFDIADRKGYFRQHDAKWISEPGRLAEIYLFAWNGRDGEETDHRDPSQWEFHVVPARLLPIGQKTIGLSRVRSISAGSSLDSRVSISTLAQTVGSCLGAH